jgi:hypothetical protein
MNNPVRKRVHFHKCMANLSISRTYQTPPEIKEQRLSIAIHILGSGQDEKAKAIFPNQPPSFLGKSLSTVYVDC